MAINYPVPLHINQDERQHEVETVLRRVVRQLRKDFEDLELEWPEDALQTLQAGAVQERLALPEDEEEPRRPHLRAAVVEGFSLHAATWVHQNDRKGLERLCRYGARGAVAMERLSVREEDGRYEYRTKHGQVLVMTAAELVRRLVVLVPPKGAHLTNFHGVFASHAKLRPYVLEPRARPAEPQPELGAPAYPSRAGAPPAQERNPGPSRPPRLDWATLQQRTFGADVWTCRCGGRRKVLALVTSRRTAEEILQNMGLLPRTRYAPAKPQAPPQLSLAL
jgi:hypothetical protein